ncbi:MAG: glycoside hydrolase family protein [Proteiniphilum sp.]|jgi:hypothetical protein|nr:glycoside hydrolase family protein [Proteiniphilum sp.]
MKYCSIIISSLLLTVLSCTQAQEISDLPEDINKPQDSPAGRSAEKRGVCFSTSALDWANRIVSLKANWYYNWGNDDVTAGVKGVEYVPMIWGHTMVNKGVCDRINQMYSEGKIFYVLGFNEPDLKEESNMSVAQALDDWEFLCNNLDKRIKLVSPAPSYPSRQWLVDFMNGAAARNLRVDYVAVHIYAGIGTSIYESAIRDVYNKFGKQVWITEFAPRDDNASSNGYNSYTMEPQVLNFMKTVAPKYEEMSEVFRYSWFSPGSETGMIGLQTSRLTSGDGLTLTVLGDYYSTIQPNDNAALPTP